MKVLAEGISLVDLPSEVSGELRLYLASNVQTSFVEELNAELFNEGLISEPIVTEARIVAIPVARDSSAYIKQKLIQSNIEIKGWQLVTEPSVDTAGLLIAGGLLLAALVLLRRK